MILQEAFASFLEHMGANRSPSSVRSYMYTFKHFHAEQVNDASVSLFLSRYDNLATRNKALGHLRSFASWVARQPSLRQYNLVGDFTLQQQEGPRSLPIIRTGEEIESFLRTMATESLECYPHAMIMIQTGLRFSEAYSLTKEHYRSIEGGHFIQFRGKRQRERIVPLNDAAYSAFTAWVSGEKPHPSKIYRKYKQVAKRIGASNLVSHHFRHSFAAQVRSRGVSYDTLSDLLGNSVEVCRRNYTTTDTTTLRKALES